MKKALWIVWCCLVLVALPVMAACPSMDFTGDCRVGLADFAVFAGQWMAEGSYTLHVNSSGTLGVSIASSTGHDGTTNYTQTLTVGTGVTLTAPATAGGKLFMDWTGDANSIDQTLSFSMNADKTVTANYSPLPDDLVIIPAGTFQMGNSTADEGWPDELVHTVAVDSFAMGKYEITNGQYCAFLNSAYPSQLKVVNRIVYASSDAGNSYPYCATSSSLSQIVFSNNTFSVSVQTMSGRDMTNDPMVMVSWYGAVAYCSWRSQQEGKQICYNLSNWNLDTSKKGYRLATEAEWEYAARGGISGNRFPWGDTINQTQANFHSSNYIYDVSSDTNQYHPLWDNGGNSFTSPVGFFDGSLKYKTQYNWPDSATSYQTTSGANGYGLYDMAGNVWEWCHDWYGSYSSSSQTNPTGPETGSYRVARGGGWRDASVWCRISIRNYGGGPDNLNYGNGFRVVLDF